MMSLAIIIIIGQCGVQFPLYKIDFVQLSEATKYV